MKIISRSIFALVAVFGILGAALTAQAGGKAIEGTFIGKSDHITTGKVSIEKHDGKYIVTLHEDFSLDGAPDPKLGFGNSGSYDGSTTFHKLNNLTGKQVYELPAGIDPTAYNEFYIWCEKFSVPLGVASIH